MILKDTGEVLSYNYDQNKRTSISVAKGDRIEWKRNGARGGVKALVIGFSDDKPGYVFIENWRPDWTAPYTERPRVWIRTNSVLKVFEYVSVDGEVPVALEQFFYENAAPDVEPLTEEEISFVRKMKPGEEGYVGICLIKKSRTP